MQNQLQVCTQRLHRVNNRVLKFSGPVWYLYPQLVHLQFNIYEVKKAMIESSLKQTSRDLQLQIPLLYDALNYTPGVDKLRLELEQNSYLKE